MYLPGSDERMTQFYKDIETWRAILVHYPIPLIFDVWPFELNPVVCYIQMKTFCQFFRIWCSAICFFNI